RGAPSRGEDPSCRRQQLRRRGHGGAREGAGRRPHRRERGPLQPAAPRDRGRPPALVPAAPAADHRVLTARGGTPVAPRSPRPRARRGETRGDVSTGRAGVADPSSRRHRDPQIATSGPRAGEPWRRRPPALEEGPRRAGRVVPPAGRTAAPRDALTRPAGRTPRDLRAHGPRSADAPATTRRRVHPDAVRAARSGGPRQDRAAASLTCEISGGRAALTMSL